MLKAVKEYVIVSMEHVDTAGTVVRISGHIDPAQIHTYAVTAYSCKKEEGVQYSQG